MGEAKGSARIAPSTALIAMLVVVVSSLASCGNEQANGNAATLTPVPLTPTPTVTATPTPTTTSTATPSLTATPTPTNTPAESRPDLIPISVQPHCAPGESSCAPLMLLVCIDNQGPGDASSFLVSINDHDDARIAGLPSGGNICVDVVYTDLFQNIPQPSVFVDSLNEVDESNEANNVLTFPQPSGTMCDIICSNHTAAAAPAPTPLPAAH